MFAAQERRAGAGVPAPHLRRDVLGGLDADAGVPLPRREHGHLIQKLVDPGQEVVPVFGLVRHVVKDLREQGSGGWWGQVDGGGVRWMGVGSCGRISRLLLTSSVISVAMERPISWYCGPFPNGPSSRNRNLDQKEAENQHVLGGRGLEGERPLTW